MGTFLTDAGLVRDEMGAYTSIHHLKNLITIVLLHKVKNKFRYSSLYKDASNTCHQTLYIKSNSSVRFILQVFLDLSIFFIPTSAERLFHELLA